MGDGAMLKLTEIKRRSTTEATASPIRLSRHAVTKVEEATDVQFGPCLKILSDEMSTMLCEGSMDEFDKQIRELEARENGDADAIAGLLALVEALTARVEELENNTRGVPRLAGRDIVAAIAAEKTA